MSKNKMKSKPLFFSHCIYNRPCIVIELSLNVQKYIFFCILRCLVQCQQQQQKQLNWNGKEFWNQKVAWLPVEALRLIWSCGLQHKGVQTPPVTHYTQAQHYAPSTFWSFSISSEISSMKKSGVFRALVCYAQWPTQLPTQTSFLPLASPWLWKIRDRLQLVTLTSLHWENDKEHQ